MFAPLIDAYKYSRPFLSDGTRQPHHSSHPSLSLWTPQVRPHPAPEGNVECRRAAATNTQAKQGRLTVCFSDAASANGVPLHIWPRLADFTREFVMSVRSDCSVIEETVSSTQKTASASSRR